MWPNIVNFGEGIWGLPLWVDGFTILRFHNSVAWYLTHKLLNIYFNISLLPSLLRFFILPFLPSFFLILLLSASFPLHFSLIQEKQSQTKGYSNLPIVCKIIIGYIDSCKLVFRHLRSNVITQQPGTQAPLRFLHIIHGGIIFTLLISTVCL